jgi:hypothetical protein
MRARMSVGVMVSAPAAALAGGPDEVAAGRANAARAGAEAGAAVQAAPASAASEAAT